MAKDWALTLGMAGGGVLLFYGLYQYLKNKEGEIPAENSFSGLTIAGVNPAVSPANGTVSVTGSFKYKGPGGRYNVIAYIGHAPFEDTLFLSSGVKDLSLGGTKDDKTVSFSIPIQLSADLSSVYSPYDIMILIFDVTGNREVDSVTRTGLLTVTVAYYHIAYSISPAGAGYWVAPRYGVENGILDEPDNVHWFPIDVEATPGWAFDHYGGTATFAYPINVKSNSAQNKNSTMVAFFVPSSQKAMWSISSTGSPYNVKPPNINVDVTGADTYSFYFDSPRIIGFNVGDRITVMVPPGAGQVFDHWMLDGNNRGASNPIVFDITDTVGHTLVAVMRGA